MIRMQTLGAVAVYRNGSQVDLPIKAAVTLAILAHTTKQRLGKVLLADWMWPKAAKPLHSLDQALHTLRKQLGPNTIHVDSGELVIRSPVESDYFQVLGCLREGDLLGACEQAGGSFLE